MRYRKTRPASKDTIDISVKVIEGDPDQQGEMLVEITNWMPTSVAAPVVLECNMPLLFMDGTRVLNDLGRPSTTVQTKSVNIPGGKTVERAFHWLDTDDSLKFLRVRVMFRSSKSEWVLLR